MNGYCGFGDCFAVMLGFALLGVGAGVGVTYLAAQNRKHGWTKRLGKRGATRGSTEEPEAEMAGYRRSRRRSLRGCGCGG